MGFLTKKRRASITPDGEEAIWFDASLTEDHGVEADVSEKPVEVGIDVTDNYRVKARPFAFTGLISNTPLSASGIPAAAAVDSVNALVDGDEDPVLVAWKALNAIFDEAKVVTITTSLNTYENMVLTSLRVTRDVSNGQVLRCAIQAKEIRFTSTVSVDAIIIPKKAAAQKETKRGKQTNKAAEPAQEPRSLLAKGLDALTGGF